MHKTVRTKVRLHRSDAWRTVLTDTSPFEVPIIFSNDGFYKNLSQYEAKSPKLKSFIDALVLSDFQYTVPYNYSIVKEIDSLRTLSLVHPQGQAQIAKFYQRYDQLICEYGDRSPFSIRKPTKIGTAYFYQSSVSDRNKYKTTSVDTEEIDKLVRNPASYFSYFGFDRLYRFFLSDDHIRLEKKYKFLLSLDVGKCFDSIYTHSIAWAVKSKELAKENTRSYSFGNAFDRLMQRLNHNETSGICIGPEASRVFAEIIFAEIDQNVAIQLRKRSLHERDQYECRRYVDNYYVFANSESTLDAVKHELSLALREYKLHLNEAKSETLQRPFYTSKSLVIDRVDSSIQGLWDRTLEVEYHSNERFELPRRIFRYRALFGVFTREIKAACYASNMGYDAVANYIIGAIRRKVVDLADSYEEASKLTDSTFQSLHYRQLFLLLLDIGFYFFTLHPTVASSLRLSLAVVRVGQHMSKHDAEGFEIAREATLRWTSLLAKSPSFSSLYKKRAVIPIEFLNVLLSLQEFSGDASLEADLLEKARLEDSDNSYFHLIVRMFIFRKQTGFEHRKESAFDEAKKRILGSRQFHKESELVHLLLDILACPYIDRAKRAELVRDVWPTLKSHHSGVGSISKSVSLELVDEIQRQHWFVRWENIDLLNMIEKKELSAVYP
ncbi:MAG: RNA-directed DNA polymerase [Paracoccaceae bacterium]|nr:RNA-directed DNA polymerase [Paracoccaceae bacterium]